jgi:hypothetical protein
VSILEDVTGALLDALAPLGDMLADENAVARLLAQYGWAADIPASQVGAINTAFGTSLLAEAMTLASQIESSAADPVALVEQLATMVPGIVSQLQGLAAGSASLAFAPFNTAGFWAQFAPDLVNGLIADYLERQQPLLHAVAALFGLIERVQVPATASGRVPYEQSIIHWDQLAATVTGPGKRLAQLYHWGAPGVPFDHDRLMRAVERVLLALGVPVRRRPVQRELAGWFPPGQIPPAVRELAIPLLAGVQLDGGGYLDIGLIIAPVPPHANPAAAPDGLVGYPVARGYDTYAIPLVTPFTLELGGGFDADGGVVLEVHPGTAAVTTQLPALTAAATLTGVPAQPWVPVGSRDGIHLEVPGLLAALQVQGLLASPEVLLTIGTGPGPTPPSAALVLQFTDGDSFIRSLFGSAPQRIEFGLGIAWSSKTGLSVQTAAGLQLTFPVNRTLGGVSVRKFTAALRPDGSTARLRLGVSAAAAIGPVGVTADNVGAELALVPRAAGAPAQVFGDLGVTFGFAGPAGLGVSIDAGPVSGGGYLSFDPATRRYSGALELRMESLALKAVGLLDTRLPDGSAGYSLIIVITAEFPAIQLGFGFTLTGVGGLAAINRGAAVDALRAGIRQHTLNAILFPPDPVRNAGQLLTDLGRVFPAQPGHYVFGPMIKLGWGTPQILSVELAVLLELPPPVRLIVLGRMALLLPDPDDPLLKVQMDSLGVVDFGTGQVAIDATLFDSSIAGFALTGVMALRAGWLGQPSFVLAIGGFNPAFSPPPGFPALARLQLALTAGDNPRVRLSAYLALTSNTAQFGAELDLFVQGPFGISLDGRLSFDALFQFNPFQFAVSIGGAVTVRYNGQPVLSASVQITLTGPNGWHIRGQASFQLFGAQATVSFDTTIGTAQPLPAPPPAQLAQLLEAALSDPASWASTLPADAGTLLTFAATPPGARAPAHPLARLSVHQHVLPLNTAIARFGSATPADPGTFTIAHVTVGGVAAALGGIDDWFAPGQYLVLSDTDALARPSFERMPAGVTVSTAGFAHDATPPPAVSVGYRTLVYDTLGATPREVSLPGPASLAVLAPRAAASSTLETAAADSRGRNRFQAPGLALGVTGPAFVLAATATLTPLESLPPAGTARTFTAAAQVRAQYLAANPGQAGQVQIVTRYEAAA